MRCQNEDSVGDVGASCRFDFTLAFASFALSILPSCCGAALVVLRAFAVRKVHCRVAIADLTTRIKLALVTGTLLPDVLVLTQASKLQSALFTTASALVLISDVSLGLNTLLTGKRPSFMAGLYLLVVSTFDGARLRQLVLLDTGQHLLVGAFSAAFALRVILLAAEQVPSSEAPFSSLAEVALLWPVNRLFWRRKKITVDELDYVKDDVNHQYERFLEHWHRQYACDRRSGWTLSRVLLATLPSHFYAPLFPCVILGISTGASPFLLKTFLAFISSSKPNYEGYALAVGWGLLSLAAAISESILHYYVWRAQVAAQTVLSQAIYEKILRLHLKTCQDAGPGSISSHLTVDLFRITRNIDMPFKMLEAILVAVMASIVLESVQELASIGPIVCLCAATASIPVVSMFFKLDTQRLSTLTDRRSKLLSSILSCMPSIKMGAYEAEVEAHYLQSRDAEFKQYRHNRIEQAKQAGIYNLLFQLLGRAVGFVPFAVYAAHGGPAWNSSSVFVTLAAFNALMPVFFFLAWRWGNVISTWSSLARVERFLQQQECPEAVTAAEDQQETGEDDEKLSSRTTIALKEASFGLGQSSFISDVTCTLPPGLTMVIGSVASGKSSFLNAMLGELDLQKGSITFSRKAKIAYAAQDAALLSGTIRSAIVLSEDEVAFDEKRYRLAIANAHLTDDIESFPDRDEHAAAALSGGQRQRVSLARCLYADADLYLLDDVFSALDAESEAAIFLNLFGEHGVLRGRTTALVSNDPKRFRCADLLVHLQAGSLVEQGRYEALIAAHGPLQEFLAQLYEANDGSQMNRASIEQAADGERENINTSAGRHVTDIDAETRSAGKAGLAYALWAYLRLGGIWGLLSPFCCTVPVAILQLGLPVYLRYWVADANRYQHLAAWNCGLIGILLLWAVTMIPLSLPIMNVWLPYASLKALHNQAAFSLFRLPISFFHDHSSGVLLNRFTADSAIAEQEWISAYNECIDKWVSPVSACIFAAVQNQWTLLIIAGILLIAFFLRKFYIRSGQQLRQMEHAYRAPLFSIATQACDPDGLKTIRAFGMKKRLTDRARRAIRESNEPFLAQSLCQGLFGLILATSAAPLAALIACLAVAQRGSDQGLLAVALVGAVTLPKRLIETVVALARLEVSSIALSRLLYMRSLAAEDVNDTATQQTGETQWLQTPTVSFSHVSMRYREDLPYAIRDVSFDIDAGARIGICGKSGSSKSTLLSLLFRLHDIEKGAICIDGRDITTLPRHDLRAALCAIPQDPLLLDLSLRENLAPRGNVDDLAIWNALELVGCRHRVEALEGGLDFAISTNGGELSRGTKQLFALCRAILQKPKLLVLDEASSSLDVQTDAQIQHVLRNAFAGATVIVVAHRISTIRDMDEIFVMEQGQLAERGAPADLSSRPDSLFRQLAGEHFLEAQ